MGDSFDNNRFAFLGHFWVSFWLISRFLETLQTTINILLCVISSFFGRSQKRSLFKQRSFCFGDSNIRPDTVYISISAFFRSKNMHRFCSSQALFLMQKKHNLTLSNRLNHYVYSGLSAVQNSVFKIRK